MIVERSMSDPWLSNTYIVADEVGGSAVMIDAGGPVAPLLEFLRRGQLTLTHVLLTHHHDDHAADLTQFRRQFPDVPVLIHELERRDVPGATGTMAPGQRIETGALVVEPIHTPGHTAGMLSLLVDGSNVFTGDTLFKGSVGGVRAPGHTTYADLKTSIMDRLLKLPPETRIHPGHTDPTTVADELEHNRFVRIWRGVDPEGDEPCTAMGEPATLILLGDDYDGGHKAWVRWPDGRDDMSPARGCSAAEERWRARRSSGPRCCAASSRRRGPRSTRGGRRSPPSARTTATSSSRRWRAAAGRSCSAPTSAPTRGSPATSCRPARR